MSHKALNWALEQTSLKASPWRVLVMLADRVNKDTRQCNPRQALLAADCNMSRSSLNNQLDTLEELGFIQRVERQDPVTKKQLSTFYILGLDFDDPPHVENAVSKNRTRDAVSKKTQKPCPKNDESRVQNLDTKNPISRTIKEEPLTRDARARDTDLEFLEKLIEINPRGGNPFTLDAVVRAAFNRGVTREEMIKAVRLYARENEGNALRYLKPLEALIPSPDFNAYLKRVRENGAGTYSKEEMNIKVFAGVMKISEDEARERLKQAGAL